MLSSELVLVQCCDFQEVDAMHYELSSGQKRILAPLEQFSHMKIDTSADATVPVLYVTMATWIPKCNLYQQFEYVENCNWYLLTFVEL